MRQLLLISVFCAGCKHAPPQAPARPQTSTPSALARSWFLQARVAEEHGELQHADYAITWMVRLDRANPWAQLAAGAYYERQGRPRKAVEAYQAAVYRAPLVPAQLGLGRAWLALGEEQAAEAPLRAAADAGDPDAPALLVGLLLRHGRRPEARERLQAWRTQPLEAEGASQRARLAMQAGLPSLAMDDLLRVLQGREDGAEIELQHLLEASTLACRVGSLRQLARSTSAPYPGWWPALALAAGRRAHDPELVRRALSAQASADPEALAQNLEALGAWEQLLTALGPQPSTPAGWVRRGRALAALQRPEEADRAWSQVPLTHPSGPGAYALRVQLWWRASERDRAAELLRQAPAGLSALAPLRARQLAISDPAAAERLLRRTAGWSSARASHEVAELRLELGDHAGFVRALRQADDALAWRTLARDAELRGERARAVACYLTLLDRDPDDADAWLALAVLRDDADDLAHALRANPCHPQALLLAAQRADCATRRSLLERAWEAGPLVPGVGRVFAQEECTE